MGLIGRITNGTTTESDAEIVKDLMEAKVSYSLFRLVVRKTWLWITFLLLTLGVLIGKFLF